MASSTTVKVGLSQMVCGEDPKRNLANQLVLAEQALKKGAKIFCTQELFRSQYFCQIEDHRFFALAETIPGPSTDAFAKLAKKYQAVIIASLFDRHAHLLGPVVSRGSAPDGDAGRRNPVLPHRHRLAPVREEAIRRGAARFVGNHAAQPRDRQWLLRVRS